MRVDVWRQVFRQVLANLGDDVPFDAVADALVKLAEKPRTGNHDQVLEGSRVQVFEQGRRDLMRKSLRHFAPERRVRFDGVPRGAAALVRSRQAIVEFGSPAAFRVQEVANFPQFPAVVRQFKNAGAGSVGNENPRLSR